MRYQVKFQRNGKTIFGIVRYASSSDKDVQAAKARGEVIVDDAVYPVSYSVKESDLTDIKSEFGSFDPKTREFVGGDELRQHVQAELKKAVEANEAVTDGVGVGSMFRVGVADGYASYVVTKVNKKTCKVEWRGFGADRYTDHHFGYGGTFKLDDVARYVEGERTMNRIFSKKKA